MNYWWVNHKQTAKKEIGGGYIWAPKINKDNSFNQTYENLKYVAVGDIIFSYANVLIKAIGIIESTFTESEVPDEFGITGNQWNNNGYLVRVFWITLERPLSPKSIIGEIQDLLPTKYSPLQQNGNGNQKCYLARISPDFAGALLGMLVRQNEAAVESLDSISTSLIDDFESKRISELPIKGTEKVQLIKARIGQGIYKSRLMKIEHRCRVTGMEDPKFLIASHIKPWRLSDNYEKLDGNNGLLLSPHIDSLFDRGWISFTNNGDFLVSTSLIKPVIISWGIHAQNVGSFNKKQSAYLDFHRENIYNPRII